MKLAARHELCSGCRVCELVCAVSVLGEQNPRLAALRARGKFPSPGVYQVTVCNQCGTCAEACPFDAIEDAGGHWRIREDRCTGCLACVEACPLGAMFVHSSRITPIKCVACGECIAYCPREVLYDGEVASA